METKKPWLAELSLALILPAILYVVFASSAVWAKANPYWTNFYAFFSDPLRIQVFNFWSSIILLGGAFVAFVLAVVAAVTDSIQENKKVSVLILDIIAGVLSGVIFVSIILFYSGVNVFSMVIR